MLGVNDAGNAFIPLWFSGSYLGYAISGSEQMRLTSTGLGIGTSSPAAKLDVAGTYNGTQAVFGFTSGRGLLIGTALNGGTNEGSSVLNARGAGSGQFLFQTDGTTRMTLDTSGNLGLGVTPYAWRSAYKAFDTVYGAFYGATLVSGISNNATYTSTNWIYRDTQPAVRYEQNTGTHLWFTAPSGTAGNAITFTQAMTLDATGKLLIGATSGGSGKLYINAGSGRSIDATGTSVVLASNSDAHTLFLGDNNFAYFQLYTPASPTYLAFQYNSAEKMRLTSNGNLGIGSTGPGTNRLVIRGDATTNFAVAKWSHSSNASSGFDIGYASSVASNDISIWNYENGFIRFATNGSERVRIDSTGKVGIGTTGPVTQLQVNSGSSYVAGFKSTVANGYIALQDSGTSGALTDGNVAIGAISNDLAFRSGGATRMRLDSGGDLGLGYTPNTWYSTFSAFQFGGNGSSLFGRSENNMAAIGSNVYVNAAGSNTYINTNTASYYQQLNGQHQFYTAPSGTAGTGITFTQAMTLDASGNLGIGTTSPAAKIDIGGNPTYESRLIWARGNNDADFKAVLSSGDAGTTATVGSIGVTYGGYKDFSSIQFYRNSTTGQILFFTGNLTGNGTEKMRLDSSGNLLIGTTSNTNGSRIFVVPSANTSPAFACQGVTGDVSNPAAIFGKFDNNTTTSQILVRFTINNNTAGSGQITANGANTAAFGSYSDERLKENIVDLAPQLTNIMALRPVEFDYIESEGGGHQTGFIAQNMESIYPDVVGEREDGMKMISGWSKTEARLVKAIQEQQAIIESLKARLDAANL